MTVKQIEMAKHAVGLYDKHKPYHRAGKAFYKPWRNFYSTATNDPDWNDLVQKGMATGSPIPGGRTIFCLTRAGLDELGKEIEVTIKDA